MKHFLIKYHFTNGTKEDWHKSITEFISSVEHDPELKGKLSYQCMENTETGDYYHLAAPANEEVVKILEARQFFKNYTEKIKLVAGGTTVVMPLEVIAETR